MARLPAAGSLLLAIAVAACAGPAPTPVQSPSAPPTVAPSATPAPTADSSGALDAKIDIGGGRMTHVLCRGEAKPGVPTLWLENGLDGSLHNWASVRGPLQQLTRVCGWDRPGNGDSDPPRTTGRTIDDVVDDLEATIDGAHIDGPFVLVAHSLGPWVSTVFSARRPDDVAGLVFVDPRGPHVTSEHLEALGPAVAGEPSVVSEVRTFLRDGQYDDNAEHVDFAPSEAIVARLLDADGPFYGDRPLLVLDAGAGIDGLPPLPDGLRQRWWDIWVADQQRYADESTAGALTVVRGSGHLMMDDRPRAVIDAVREVLEATTSR